MIVPGSASQSLAATLAGELDRPLATVEYDRFPDGELLVRFSNPDITESDQAIIVSSTISSDTHLETLLLQDACIEAGIDRITTVIPYLGYARQDKAFEPGQPVSIRAIARAISVGTDRILTVNPHETAVCNHFDVNSEIVDAAESLARALPTDLHRPLFLAPDRGALSLAERVQAASEVKGVVDHFEKTRLSGREVEIDPSSIEVDDRDVIVIDDIVATGSTMSTAIEIIRELTPRRIIVGCVHPLFVGNARTKLITAGVDRLVGTDTIERPESSVSVAQEIAEFL